MRNLLQTDVADEEEDWPVEFSERIKCFDFNRNLDQMMEDYSCDHCNRYLTLQCPHISAFLEEYNEAEE